MAKAVPVAIDKALAVQLLSWTIRPFLPGRSAVTSRSCENLKSNGDAAMLYHLLKSDPDAFYAHPDFTGFWYYAVEVAPGKFTPGLRFPNLALTRQLLRQAQVRDLRCYDIGTMEAVIPTLLAKRRAAKVVALDGINYSRKIGLVKALHQVDFDYHPNVQLDNAVNFIRSKARMDGEYIDRYDYRADLTIIAGILYHVFSPFHLIGYARSLTRRGGLVLLETAALRRDAFYMQYNFHGSGYIYDWTDTWFPTLPVLDYMLRMCKLQPLDMLWLNQTQYPDLIRVAVVCRATDDVLAERREAIMGQSTSNIDHNIFVDTFGDTGNGVEVPFARSTDDLVMRDETKSCDLFRTAMTRSAHNPDPNDLELRLDALS